VDYGLSVASQNQKEDEDDAGHMSRSSGLLHVEVSRIRVFRLVEARSEWCTRHIVKITS
jgi:hypothetical protein